MAEKGTKNAAAGFEKLAEMVRDGRLLSVRPENRRFGRSETWGAWPVVECNVYCGLGPSSEWLVIRSSVMFTR